MILTKNTLFNISKHTNKTIKIADYLSKANQPLLFNKMAMVNEDSSDIAYIEAFNKDLGDTTKKLEDVHMLLSTVGDDGRVLHLKGEQKLSEIFGSHYDQEEQTIKLPFGKISLKSEFSRDAVKAAIVENYLDITPAQYNTLFKGRNTIFKHSKDQLYSDEEKIEFLSTVADRELYENAVSSIKEMAEKYTTFRSQLTLEERSLVDDKITFQRSMVDSITKGSTYITKVDGIVQVGSGHKKQTEGLNKIIEELKNNKYIDSVELDTDTDLEAFLNLMQQTKKMKFNLKEAVSLKSRKLGNYNANGLFYSRSNIVAVDVKSPSAAVHEFVHAVDLKNNNIRYSQKRQNFASKMRSYLDLSGMSKKDFQYYNSTAEIIARAGEIAYLFEEFDYNPEKESIKNFEERISEKQDKDHPYDLNLVKNISVYLKKSNIYFDLEKMKNEDLKMMREYYKSYFRIKEDLKIENLKSVAIPDHVEHKVIGERTRYVATSVGLINEDNIVKLFEYNEKNKIIEPSKLINEIISNPLKLNRTTKSISNAQISSKNDIIAKLCNWAEENDDFYLMSRIAEARIRADVNINKDSYFLADALINTDEKLSINFMEQVGSCIERVQPLYEEDRELPYSSENRERKKEINNQYRTILNETVAAPDVELEKLYANNPLREETRQIGIQAKAFEDGKNTRLNQRGVNNFYKHVDYMLQKTFNKHGEKIFNYFNKDDMFPITILSQPNSINDTRALGNNFKSFVFLTKPENTIEPYHLSKSLVGLVDKIGQLKPMISKMDNIDIVSHPQLISQLRRGVSYLPSLISRDETKFKSEILNVVNKNCYNSILKTPLGIEKEDITYQFTKELSNYKFDSYNEIQKEIKAYKDTFKIVEPEDMDVLVEEITETQELTKDDLIKAVENKSSFKNTEVINDDSPIDPNISTPEVTKKRKGKKKTFNPNQGNLF